MPLTSFICPDKVSIDTNKCLERCRLNSRCLTRTTLRVIAGDNRWDGIPHVTQLLNGTMLEYLKITRDYAINPKDRAFALLGSSHHKLLENSGQDYRDIRFTLDARGVISELPLNNGWIQGTLDLLEQDTDGLLMVDYKCWGSNRLVRQGINGDFDPLRTPPDLTEVSMQMNMYRVLLQEIHGWEVNRMQVQCTVRDGGLAVATKRGVKENIYLLPIGKLPDGIVLAYFQAKARQLKDALDNKSIEPCSSTENWGGNRCRSYCEVAQWCPEGMRHL